MTPHSLLCFKFLPIHPKVKKEINHENNTIITIIHINILLLNIPWYKYFKLRRNFQITGDLR